MLTFSLGKHLKFSDPSIFTLSCYLISRGSTAVFPHSGRAAFLLLLHWLTASCIFWLLASHCFVGTLCSNSHSILNWFWALLRKSVICCLSTESWQPDLTRYCKGTAMSCSQSLPVCPLGSIILAWRWSKELLCLIAWWLFIIRFIFHDADECLYFCSSDHPVICTVIYCTVPNLPFFGQSYHTTESFFNLCGFAMCEKYRHRALEKILLSDNCSAAVNRWAGSLQIHGEPMKINNLQTY